MKVSFSQFRIRLSKIQNMHSLTGAETHAINTLLKIRFSTEKCLRYNFNMLEKTSWTPIFLLRLNQLKLHHYRRALQENVRTNRYSSFKVADDFFKGFHRFWFVSGFEVSIYFLSEKISSKDTPSQTTLTHPRIKIGSNPTKWLIIAVASSKFSGTPNARKITAQKAS